MSTYAGIAAPIAWVHIHLLYYVRDTIVLCLFFEAACILATLRRFAERVAFSARTRPPKWKCSGHMSCSIRINHGIWKHGLCGPPKRLWRVSTMLSAIDVLCGIGLLAPTHLENWRKGRVDCLERVIQGNLHKISRAMESFRCWAREKELKPSETGYVRRTRGGTIPLRFSRSGNESTEASYRTHYVSPVLAERKQQKLQEKFEQPSSLLLIRFCTPRNVRSAARNWIRVRCLLKRRNSRCASIAPVWAIWSFSAQAMRH